MLVAALQNQEHTMSDTDDFFSNLELDLEPGAAKPALDLEAPAIELDLSNPTQPCLDCGAAVPVNELGVCQSCTFARLHASADRASDALTSMVGSLTEALADIGEQGRANAAVVGAAATEGGAPLPGVGFRTQDGYIQAIRNGVKAETHREYLGILRDRFRLSGTAIAALKLPGPMAESALPEGAGITHTPAGPSIFDRPRAERQFVVGPREVSRGTTSREVANTVASSKDLVAGAVAEGHHAIVAWEGTSGMTRGALVAALESIDRADWAPKAPSARAHAGTAILSLSKGGLHVKALRKTATPGANLESGEHVWTVGKVAHVGQIGENYGSVVVRFKLSGVTLTATGDDKLAAPVLADYQARMASELFKSSDLTSWLSSVIMRKLDGVRFGALGWLVPARNVEIAGVLTKACEAAGFGHGWVHGLPVATSDQLRDGIVRGLVSEVDELSSRLSAERAAAHAARVEFIRSGQHGRPPVGDIGKERAETYLREFRAVGSRVVGYGKILGEHRVEHAQLVIREAMAQLEGIAGADFSGIRERFGLIWEEIERDRAKAGGVL
jgi:hypothetical protein